MLFVQRRRSASAFFVRPTWAITWRWKSATRLAVGSVSRTARVSIVRWNLKEAEGKVPNRRTEIAYKAEKGRTSLQHKMKSNTARTPASKCGGYMGWRLLHLIRGGLRGKLQQEVQESITGVTYIARNKAWFSCIDTNKEILYNYIERRRQNEENIDYRGR